MCLPRLIVFMCVSLLCLSTWYIESANRLTCALNVFDTKLFPCLVNISLSGSLSLSLPERRAQLRAVQPCQRVRV